MAKNVYRINAFCWNKQKRKYEDKEINVLRDYWEAITLYNRLTPSADMMQVELWEDSVNKHGITINSERIKMKDQAHNWV